MMEKYKSIIMTEAEIKAIGYEIENEVIGEVSVKYAGHFGCVTLEIMNEGMDKKLFAGYSLTDGIGRLIQFLIEFVGRNEDDIVVLNELFRERPIRAVYKNTNSGRECVGIGDYKKDGFFLWNALASLKELKID